MCCIVCEVASFSPSAMLCCCWSGVHSAYRLTSYITALCGFVRYRRFVARRLSRGVRDRLLSLFVVRWRVLFVVNCYGGGQRCGSRSYIIFITVMTLAVMLVDRFRSSPLASVVSLCSALVYVAL